MGRTIYMKPKFVGSAPRKLSGLIAAPISFVLISSLLDRSLHSLFASCHHHHHHHLSGGSNVDRLRSAAAAAKIGGRSFKLVMSFPPSLFFLSLPFLLHSFSSFLPWIYELVRLTLFSRTYYALTQKKVNVETIKVFIEHSLDLLSWYAWSELGKIQPAGFISNNKQSNFRAQASITCPFIALVREPELAMPYGTNNAVGNIHSRCCFLVSCFGKAILKGGTWMAYNVRRDG